MNLFYSSAAFLYLATCSLFAQDHPTSDPDQQDISLGLVNVAKQCTGSGTPQDPWKSSDGSAGIRPSLAKLTVTRKIVYFPPGIYYTQGAQEIDFGKCLPGITDPSVRQAFVPGILFEGKEASFYINGGGALTGGHPGLLFRWTHQDIFYWKFTGLSFGGNVDAPLVQFGINDEDFPLNDCDMDLIASNAYVPPDYATKPSPSRAITVYRALESRLHFVAISATGYGAELSQAAFCTISGAFSNTVLPHSYTAYPFSYGLRLNNCGANTFTSMDLEVTKNGIKFDGNSIQNTFTAIWVGNCDPKGYVFDNSGESAGGKNLVVSIRNGPTYQAPGTPDAVQEKFAPGSDETKLIIQNYF